MKLILIISFLLAFKLSAQDTIKVLHYTETTGYDHGTWSQSRDMFSRICDSLSQNTPHVWLLTHTANSEIFDTLTLLQSFKVVIWSNTSGDGGLTSSQKNNYEQYVNAGGGYLGIHAASDTYRHSSANGSNTGSWDFYAENLSGCSVQESPNHTSSNHNNTMDHIISHPILNNIPSPWNKTEEFYYWENGFIDNSFNVLLNVRTTGSNSYDSARMTTQYKTLTSGSRCFYTSLGHAASNFTTLDNDFEILNKNALYWVANPVVTTTINNIQFLPLTLYPNPVKDVLYFSKNSLQ